MDDSSGAALSTMEEGAPPPEQVARPNLPRSFTRLDPEKQKAILKQLRDAAKAAVEKGWYVFPAPYLTKTTFKGTRGSKDARNDARALTKWQAGVPANPCIRLDYSNLTVLDIDGGVGDYDNAMAWAKANGIPETYVVTTGRLGGGYHFYFFGTRPPERKDVSKNSHAGRRGFELDGAHGDIKCHGHVVAEGGLHKTRATYRGNGLLVAPLPDWLRDWEEESVKARRQTFQRQLERIRETQSANVVPWKLRNDFLYRDACRLHYLGLNDETLYAALKDIARRYCADGEQYLIQQDAKIRSIAARVSAMTHDRIVNRGLLGKPAGDLVVRAPLPKPKERLMAWLTGQFRVGEQVTVSSILERFEVDHPGERRPGRTTLFRAMKSANFREFGRDPKDGRTSLWARHPDSSAGHHRIT